MLLWSTMCHFLITCLFYDLLMSVEYWVHYFCNSFYCTTPNRVFDNFNGLMHIFWEVGLLSWLVSSTSAIKKRTLVHLLHSLAASWWASYIFSKSFLQYFFKKKNLWHIFYKLQFLRQRYKRLLFFLPCDKYLSKYQVSHKKSCCFWKVVCQKQDFGCMYLIVQKI